MAKVYLDPGHGGYDSGACGCDKREADCALDVAKRVCALLPSKHFDCKMSRSSNHTPNDSNPNADLPRRANEANAWGADIYVSIHLNAGGGHGIETLHSVVGGKSTVLAQDIQAAVLAACPGYTDRGLKTQLSSDGVHDRVCVIRESAMPSALVECAFIDNPADMSHWNADKFAQGITAGICKYFGVITNISATPQAPQFHIKYAADSATAVSDTTQTVTLPQGKAYTFRLTCNDGCPPVHSYNSAIADVSIAGKGETRLDWYIKVTGKAKGITSVGTKSKKFFDVKVV